MTYLEQMLCELENDPEFRYVQKAPRSLYIKDLEPQGEEHHGSAVKVSDFLSDLWDGLELDC